jgi:hypothetical protein
LLDVAAGLAISRAFGAVAVALNHQHARERRHRG